MKGIILAGGTGSRLWPMTFSVCKQLLPVYDKPLIYYPLSTLMLAGIREVLVITSPDNSDAFQNLLSDGSQLGISITYATQPFPNGIAQAFIIGSEFIGEDSVALILGDNFFYGAGLTGLLSEGLETSGARFFLYKVSNPSEYGVVELNELGEPISVEEKPVNPKSNLAITGLYFFDKKVVKYATEISPSKRGELEITDIIQKYLDAKDAKVTTFARGMTWLDTGTPDSLQDASLFVRIIEERTGVKIGCVEEIAFRNKWISKTKLLELAEEYKKSQYGRYLKKVAQEFVQ